MQIYCPAQLDDEQAARYINEFWRAREEPELVLNFSTLRFVYPAGALILALGARDMVRQRAHLNLGTHVNGHQTPRSACSYLMHFGFFQFIGVDQGNPIGVAPGSRSYLPITRIGHEDFREDGVVIQEQITRHSARLTTVLYPREADFSRADMLTFCLREIIRNVFEHSQARECFVMAQRWNTGLAEITIADEGVGIPYTLSQAHNVTSSRSALRMALMPGISRITDPVNDDKWQNSGFGLYVVSEVGKRLGSFSILSNGAMLHRTQEADSWLATPSRGTVVKLRANTNDAEYFPNLLQNIVNEGELLAKQIPGARPSASKGSRLVDPILW
ncbi:ATP-binding protein [Dechloromonas sp. ZY10]|uniref:ATP-binding protein n=1 Tax=Dechloromonas aquae TaxID=2664436 RepID=UPI003528F3FC